MTVFPQETLTWQRFRNVSCLRTYYEKKRPDSFDHQLENLLGYDGVRTLFLNLHVMFRLVSVVEVFCSLLYSFDVFSAGI